jgi:glucosamine--fructose-6-phosphate aminotransferase (isomerizing)
MSLHSEIHSQAEVLTSLIEDTAQFTSIVTEVRKRDPAYVFLAARGTSDNAGLYAKYLWGSVNQLPIALAAPSLFSIYGSPPNVNNALVVGISQSGQSPDIVSVLEGGRQQGALTLAITNDVNSPLADTADLVINISAGEEKAIAATKTYTAQLASIAMLSALLAKDSEKISELERLPALIQQVLSLDTDIGRMAERYRYMQHCVVLGRGYNYATAFEWSLKLKELAYIVAEPYSSADFQHGPIAIVSRGFPVLAVAPRGAVFEDMLGQLLKLSQEHLAELLVISNDERATSLAHSPVSLPKDLPEWLSPIITIIPAQLFSYYLACSRGLDPEQPRGLTKVTLTK